MLDYGYVRSLRGGAPVQGKDEPVPWYTFAAIEYLRGLDLSQRRVFEGGCFFSSTSAELGSRPGPVRDAVLAQFTDWHAFLTRTVQRAVDRGELDADPDTVAFELEAILDAANRRSLLYSSAEPYAQARSAIDRLLSAP